MAIILAILSMLIIGAGAGAANKVFNIRLCPVCAGVAGTWLLMLVLRFLEYPISTPLLTMFLGGSAVGIAYTIEKKLPPARSRMLFKAFFIPVGFITAYGMVIEDWIMAGGALLALFALVGIFLSKSRQSIGSGDEETPPQAGEESPRQEELKKKLDECC